MNLAVGATRDWIKKAKKFSFYTFCGLEVFLGHGGWKTAIGDVAPRQCVGRMMPSLFLILYKYV